MTTAPQVPDPLEPGIDPAEQEPTGPGGPDDPPEPDAEPVPA